MLSLEKLIGDFAIGLSSADARSPQAYNSRTKVPFKPGIGPHSEADTLVLIADELEQLDPSSYRDRIALNVSYPEIPRQKCDLCLGRPGAWDWAVEAKMLRILGDNGKVNDNILMHILSPYPAHRSALTDCSKLVQSKFGQKKAILIYGYQSEGWPLATAIEAFESLARDRVALGSRVSASFSGLIHPIHRSGEVYAWVISPRIVAS